MPSIDCDAALIAIRMATYGESMTLPVTVPGTKIEKDLELNLQETLTTILGATYNDTFLYENMEIKTRPLSYAEFTASALKQFEQSRLQSVINDTQMTDEEKIREFQKSFNKLTELNVGMVSKTITSIRVDGETVQDKFMIKDFIDNTSKEFFLSLIHI